MDQSLLLEGKRLLENSPYFLPEQYHAMANMLACRTIDKGGRILKCTDCGTEVVVYNPCNQRGCPTCSKKNQIQWCKKLKAKLLPTGHYHLVFSIPEEMVMVWKGDATILINSFFHSVRLAFKKIQKERRLTLGVVMVFQSHATGLSYKPHMHCIVTNHGINENKKWVGCGSLSYNTLRDEVKKTLIPHLIKKAPSRFKQTFKVLLNNCDERQWSVYPSIHKFNGENIVNYLSRSVSGGVLDMENDLDFNREENTYTIRDRHMGKERTTILNAHTFWDRYLSHIPPKGVVTIRNYGLYSNRYSDLLEQIRIREFGTESSTEELSYEESCPVCHAGMFLKEEFSPNALPLVLRLYMQRNNGPPDHGFTFKTA